MCVFGFAAMCCFLFTFATTRERIVPLASDQSSVGGDLRNLLKNRPWVALGAMSILFLTWVSIRGACLIYYFKYFVGREDLTSAYLVAGTVCSLAGVVLTAPLTRLFGGKKRTYIGLTLINAATLLPMFFAGPKDLVLIFGCQILGSLFTGSLNPLVWAMYADTADYAEWKFGGRATGLIFSAGTFAQKMGWTIGGALAGWLLAFYGYQANIAQNAGTLLGIRLLVSLLPAAACILTVIAAGFYNLDATFLARIAEELQVRREGAAGATTTA